MSVTIASGYGFVTLRVTEYLSVADAPLFRRAYESAPRNAIYFVYLQRINRLDSAGMCLLACLFAHVDRTANGITFVCDSQRLIAQLREAGFDTLCTIR